MSRLGLVSGYIIKRLGLVSLICKRSKPMSNFVQFVQKQTFYEHRYMPVPSNTACCIYDKCVTNGSLVYVASQT